MSNLRNIYERIYRWIEEALIGFSTSITVSIIWEEIIRGLSVIFWGILSTIAIHYVNKWLKKNEKPNS